MDYIIMAKELLVLYPIVEPEIQFIRHNENMTFKVTDKLSNKNYLLRIHKPAIEGFFGLQHTIEGLKAEIEILKRLGCEELLHVQLPVENRFGEYITQYKFDNYDEPCYATVLEWIDGEILTSKEEITEEIAFKLGQNLALFHKCLEELTPSDNFVRPIYNIDKIDIAIEELKYCVEAELFSIERYNIIRDVLISVKNQMNELKLRNNAFGVIHADIQLGNVIISRDNPCIIDLGFCGFGYYLFDLGSAATIFPSNLRQNFLQGYASKAYFSFEDLRYIEGQIFMDVFMSYTLFMRDNQRNSWIKTHAIKTCDTLCRDFLEGKEVFYSM